MIILKSFKTYGSRYVIVGATGTISYFCLLKLLVDVFKVDPIISSGLSVIPMIIGTYLANYFWTFQSSHNDLVTLSRFAAISLLGLLLNLGIMHLWVNVLGLWYLWGAIITVLVVATTNFILHLYWSFRLLER